jgi:glutamate-1-semialdehyde 2,1-aminomutase
MSQDNRELLETAARYLPGGSTWMWSLPRDLSFVVARAEGSRVIDTAGRSFIDYALGSGPLLLGHAHPALTAAVHAQIDKGSTYQWLSEPTIKLAEMVCRAAPCADMIRFMSTGTEATMFAMRMARTFTQREKIVKFEGGWHGLHDYALVGNNWRPRDAPYPTPAPDVGGIPKGALESVLVVPFNDGRAVEDTLDRYDGEVAAVIVEPLQRAIAPRPGFLARLRELTERRGIVLIFDEVVTGFRLAYGGAQEFYGVTPDLATYGKAMSCGYPLAAVAGRRELMATADPARKGSLDYACLSGTLSGNPIACAAGVAALGELSKPGVYERLHALGRRLRAGMSAIAATRGVPLQALGEGPIAQPIFIDPARPILGERDLAGADGSRATRLGHELIRRGVFVIPGAKMYISLAHSDGDIEHTLGAFEDALAAVSAPNEGGTR